MNICSKLFKAYVFENPIITGYYGKKWLYQACNIHFSSTPAGFLGSIFTAESVSTWYTTLQKPVFTPPSWVFAPAWTTLYVLMGISLYLVWREGFEDKEIKIGVGIFSVQLVLNVLWTFLFFGLKSPLLGLLEIVILWVAILATIVYFYRISKMASYLLVPYLAWTTFAALLNYYIFLLN